MPEQIQNVIYLFSQEIRKILGDDLCKIIVYGSYARGDFDENSDVDVMVLTSLTESDIKPKEYMLYDVAFDFLMEYWSRYQCYCKKRGTFQILVRRITFLQ